MIYPGATKVNIIDRDGGAMVGGPPRAGIHTTETNPKWGFFEAKWFYSLQFLLAPGSSTVEILQTFDLARASRALYNGPDPVQTNRMGSSNPQVTIIGYAKDSPSLPDPLIWALAEFFAWDEETQHNPAIFPLDFGGGESYGTSGVGRMSIPEWRVFTGICGHQDVPDGNTHWDPGRIPVDKLRAAIKAIKGEEPKVATYRDVKNMPTNTDGTVTDWAKGIVDRHIARGIIVTSDNVPDDWAVNGSLWIFMDRLVLPIERELDAKDRAIGALRTTVTNLQTALDAHRANHPSAPSSSVDSALRAYLANTPR